MSEIRVQSSGKGVWAYLVNYGEPLMIFEHRSDMIRVELKRMNLEIVCGKELRQELEHFTTWKALLNIHLKN